jgi:hypothetical protein
MPVATVWIEARSMNRMSFELVASSSENGVSM